MTVKKVSSLVLISCFVFALAACKREKIADIVADPGRYQDKEVAVAGEVTQSMGVLGQGIYQIDDGTGQLWVLSTGRGVPSKGAKVGVKGRITPTVTFMGKNYATVMRESERKSAE